jgi:hypothetical protein
MFMNLDDALFVVIVSGVALCAAYFRDEYIGWREHRAADMRRETSMRELHIDRFSHQEDSDSVRCVVNLAENADAESAGTEDNAGGRVGPQVKIRKYSMTV